LEDLSSFFVPGVSLILVRASFLPIEADKKLTPLDYLQVAHVFFLEDQSYADRQKNMELLHLG